MLKAHEISDPNSCWNKARDDERMFILLERDLSAPGTIRDWIVRRYAIGLNKPGDDKIFEAANCAAAMEETQKDTPGVREFSDSAAAFLNDCCHQIHRLNQTWWHDPANNQRIHRNVGEMLMLIVSEIAEAMEGHRKDLMDDKLPHRKMFEVEMADALIRIFDICGGLGFDLGGAFVEKLFFNKERPDHKPEARLQKGGKKY